jgi:PAS domain S-box-containing protein
MSDPTLTDPASATPFDDRLRDLLRELPEAQAALVSALIRERDGLVGLAERRAERLQRLQEVSATLSRSLDRDDIERELARQVARMIDCAGVVIARAEGEEARAVIALHWRDGAVTTRESAEPTLAAITEVARSGRASRASAVAAVAAVAVVAGAAGAPVKAVPAVLAVPLLVGYRLAAIVAVYGDEADAFGTEEEELLQTIGATAATALVNANLFAESLREKRQSEALASMAGAIGSSLRLSDVLRLALRHALAILGTEGASVALRRGEFLHVVGAIGSFEPVQGLYIPIAESESGLAMLGGRSVIVNDVDAAPNAYQRTRELARIRNMVASPLNTADGAIGMLAVSNRERDFTIDDVRILERLASQLAVAVSNARLFEEASEATRELSAAFDAIAGGIVVVDSEGYIVRHNARFCALAEIPDGGACVGRALYEVIFRAPTEIEDDDPLGIAIRKREVGRGSLRQSWSGRVFNVVASPHPVGGAVVTLDDVTQFHALTERYRLVVESTTDAIVITSPTGEIEFANEAADELFGPSRLLAGLQLTQLVPAELVDEVATQIRRALDGEAMRFTGAVMRTNGERRIVSMSLAPIRDGEGVSGLVISLRDVSDESRARDEVAAANARYRNLVEVADDAIYTFDASGVFTSTNAACERLLGQSRDLLLGRPILPMLVSDDVEDVRQHFHAAIGGEARRYECRIVRPDGTHRLVSVSNTPIHRGDAVTGILGVARDVTDERERAAALERAEALYTRLVESAEDAICTVDEEGNFTSVNRAMEHAVGLRREAILGRHFADALIEGERGEMWRMFAETLAGERQRRELRFRYANGRTGIASVLAAPIYEHGRISGALAILRDVTEERALLDQVVRQDKMAALGELVGGVAHEVNSPLTGILAFAQLLQGDQGGNAEESKRALDTIVNEAKRAARIVAKLLTFARQNPPEKMPTELNKVLMDTIELRRYPLKMQQIGLTVEFGESLPVTWADPFQLQQVFINLLSNAEQALANRSGERRITVRTERRGDELITSIADTGSGIALEHLPHIFNPFYTTKPRGIGTGLGLSISFGIVREHGGILRVLSEPGKGAAFEVSLPIVAPPTLGKS